jgi:hypothetical protein
MSDQPESLMTELLQQDNASSVLGSLNPEEALATLERPVSPLTIPPEWENFDIDQMRNLLAEAYNVIRERERGKSYLILYCDR